MSLPLHKKLCSFVNSYLLAIGCPLTCPTPTFEDNESCISLATNDMTTLSRKHINIKHHFVRDLIEQKVVELLSTLKSTP